MRSYTTYIFDLDGTITNTMEVWLGIFRDGLVHFNINPPDDLMLSKHTHDWNEMVKLGLPANKVEGFASLAHRLANERLPAASLHIGAYEMLESLKQQGKRLAIFSTMDEAIFNPAMQHRNLYPLVEVAVAGNHVPYRKPHPAGILKALEDLGIPQDEYKDAVYVGDKDTDIQAATNAGINSILFYPTAHQLMYDLDTLKNHNPTHIITDWQELLS